MRLAVLVAALAGACLAAIACEEADAPSGGSGGSGGSGIGTTAGEGGLTPIDPGPGPGSPCNGWSELCTRTFDSLTIPTTHAAMANGERVFDFPAQRQTLRRQLDGGIRALMLEVHGGSAGLELCLGDCAEGRAPFDGAVAEIGDFLADNPREIVALVIDNHVPAAEIARSFEDSGLADSLHAQDVGASWPTLSTMIESGARLVVFVRDAALAPPGLHPLHDFVRSTRDDYSDAAVLDCELVLGARGAPLVLVNHYLVAFDLALGGVGGETGGMGGTAPTGGAAGNAGAGPGGSGGSDAGGAPTGGSAGRPDPELAESVNYNPLLLERLRECAALHGRPPNFVAVDFYDTSDVLLATQIMSGLVIDPPADP